jgi:hypothetical protein
MVGEGVGINVMPERTGAGNAIAHTLGPGNWTVPHWVFKKTALGTLEIVLNHFGANPVTTQALRNLSGHATSRERIDDDVAGVGEHPDEVFWQVCREAGRMRWKGMRPAVAQIGAVAFGVRYGEQVRRDGSAIIDAEFRSNSMT